MKSFRTFAAALSGAAIMVLPFGLTAVAHAQEVQQQTLQCDYPPGIESQVGTEGCDLSIDKLVSVDSGKTFVEADTSAAAAQTTVGSTVIYKVVVSNTSDEGFTPYGTVTVEDTLPSGVSYVSSSATTGNYNPTTHTWVIMMQQNSEESSLPATLTITTKSTATGLFKNTAALSFLDSCNDGCNGIYNDSNPDNNSNDAWIDPSAKPKVLAASTTLPNTGGGVAPSVIAGGLIAATLAVAALGRRQSKES